MEVSIVKLTEKQQRFVDEYLIDLNATRAYKVAYPSVKSDFVASTAASRLLANVKVQVYLNERREALQRRTEITVDKVLNELAKVAFANGADFAKVVEKTYMEPITDNDGNVTGEVEKVYNTRRDMVAVVT
jgi:phage terminase small subunit